MPFGTCHRAREMMTGEKNLMEFIIDIAKSLGVKDRDTSHGMNGVYVVKDTLYDPTNQVKIPLNKKENAFFPDDGIPAKVENAK
jgi:hypothetical protein